MLKESNLIDCVQESLKAYIQNVASLETLLNSIDQSSINQALAKEYTDHISENERRLEHTQNCKSRLYESLVEGMICFGLQHLRAYLRRDNRCLHMTGCMRSCSKEKSSTRMKPPCRFSTSRERNRRAVASCGYTAPVGIRISP